MVVISETYDFLFNKSADPRVRNWPLMSDPWPILGVIAAYLYGIYVFLPSYMSNRKPYALKGIIAIYNVYQIIACTALVYGVATSGWTTHYSLGCQPVDYSEDKMALRMANMVWWHMMLKMSELVETAFFVLRKKTSQITGLHVYHHVSTLIMGWLCTKYIAGDCWNFTLTHLPTSAFYVCFIYKFLMLRPIYQEINSIALTGGMSTFTILANSSVHVLMYVYYSLALLGPEMQKKLEPLKSKLTLLQIVQLGLIFCHCSQSLFPSCPMLRTVSLIYLPNVAINIAMFVNFYMKNYVHKKKV